MSANDDNTRDIRQIVGDNVRRLRENSLSMSHAQFADQMGWSRQAVYAAEKGDRAFTASDLTVLGAILGVLPGSLLVIPDSVEWVGISEGVALARDDIQRPGDAFDSDSVSARMVEIERGLAQINERAAVVESRLADAFAAVVAAKEDAQWVADSADAVHSLAMDVRVQQLRYTQASSTQVVGAEKEEEQ